MVSVLRLSKYRAYKMAFDKAGSAMTRNLERVSRLELKLRDASPAKHSKVLSKITPCSEKTSGWFTEGSGSFSRRTSWTVGRWQKLETRSSRPISQSEERSKKKKSAQPDARSWKGISPLKLVPAKTARKNCNRPLWAVEFSRTKKLKVFLFTF